MNDPASPDDDWNDLARELGVSKSAKPVEPPPADTVERSHSTEDVEPHHGNEDHVEEAVVAEGEPESDADEEFEDDTGATGEAGEATAEGDQSGTGRKRRRRRRRRKKAGTAPEGAAAPATADDEAEVPEV